MLGSICQCVCVAPTQGNILTPAIGLQHCGEDWYTSPKSDVSAITFYHFRAKMYQDAVILLILCMLPAGINVLRLPIPCL